MARFILLDIFAGLSVTVFVYLFLSKMERNHQSAERNVFDTAPKLLHSQHVTIWKQIADNEHALGFLPHNDSNVLDVCHQCRPELFKDSSGRWINTPNEVREISVDSRE